MSSKERGEITFSLLNICFFFKEKRYLSLREEEMERENQEMGIPLLK